MSPKSPLAPYFIKNPTMPGGTNYAQALDEQATRRINDLHIAEKLEKYGTMEREGRCGQNYKN